MKSSLSRTPSPPITRTELEALRRRAWLEFGVAHLPVDEISDDWSRQCVVNLAERRYGKRKSRNQEPMP